MTNKTNPKHLAIGLIASIPFAAAIVLSFPDEAPVSTTPAPTPVEQVVEAPVVVTPAPTVTYRYTTEESKTQYKWYYNYYRNMGMGHGSARGEAEAQLRSNGFDSSVATNDYASEVRLSFGG